MIEGFSFGKMVVDGQTYTSDLILYPDRTIKENWRRKSGHELVAQDIADLIASRPEVIIAGTGAPGRMTPQKSLEKELERQGIALIAQPTEQAIETYNQLSQKRKVGACFHLTC